MDERKVSKARMRLVTSRWCRIRAPSSSMQCDKMALVLLLPAPVAHAASVRSAPVRSTAQERKIHGVLQLAFHKVQHTNPGLACSPDQAKLGCWAPQADRRDGKTCRAVPGAKTVRGSVVGFRMNVGTTCTLGPSPRRNSRQVTPHQADRRLDTSSLSSSRRQT